LYNAPDFVWTEDQLPHHHKLREDTHEVLQPSACFLDFLCFPDRLEVLLGFSLEP
jgi:hypothetical protein